LNDTLGGHVFDCGQKAAADQMRASWEKIAECVGATRGQDISNELQSEITVIIPEPTHSADVLNRNLTRSTVIRNGQNNLQRARLAGEGALQAAVTAGVDAGKPDAKATVDLATLQNEIASGNYELTEPIPLQLIDSEKTQCSNEWRTCRDRNSSLIEHRGQACSLILGQCSQLLEDKMKQDIDWSSVSISCDPLNLCRLIEKTILAQTEDQCPFATVHDQELSFCSFRQPDNMNNPQIPTPRTTSRSQEWTLSKDLKILSHKMLQKSRSMMLRSMNRIPILFKIPKLFKRKFLLPFMWKPSKQRRQKFLFRVCNDLRE
jgi:hypothetical protein